MEKLIYCTLSANEEVHELFENSHKQEQKERRYNHHIGEAGRQDRENVLQPEKGTRLTCAQDSE